MSLGDVVTAACRQRGTLEQLLAAVQAADASSIHRQWTIERGHEAHYWMSRRMENLAN